MSAQSRQEDRGTPIYVWRTAHGCAFQPCNPVEDAQFAISVPIGWSLHPDEGQGVVLKNVFSRRISAYGALKMARANEDGFRVR